MEDVGWKVVNVEKLTPPTGVEAYLRSTIEVSAGENTARFFTDVLFVAAGQVEVTVIYTNTLEAPPHERLQLIADQLSAKLRDQRPRSIAGRATDSGPVVGALGPLRG